MHLVRKNMLEAIKCHFFRNNFIKKSRLDRDFAINLKQRNYHIFLLRKSKRNITKT